MIFLSKQSQLNTIGFSESRIKYSFEKAYLMFQPGLNRRVSSNLKTTLGYQNFSTLNIGLFLYIRYRSSELEIGKTLAHNLENRSLRFATLLTVTTACAHLRSLILRTMRRYASISTLL